MAGWQIPLLLPVNRRRRLTAQTSTDRSLRSGAVSRLPLLILGLLALVTGVWAGMERLGWQTALPAQRLTSEHGPLMVCGFLGTVIGIERAVAVGARWGYAAPLLSGLAVLMLLSGAPDPFAPALATAAALALCGLALVIVRRLTAMFTVAQLVGAACWAAGNAQWWRGTAISTVVWWWAGFVVLTVAAERVEMNRFRRLSPVLTGVFWCAGAAIVAAAAAASLEINLSWRLFGAGSVVLAAWLLRFDHIWRQLTRPDLPRFTAVSLLSGYGWLAIAGILLLWSGNAAGAYYDAVLHSLFLGFGFAMIFGHAPVIFAAIVGVPVAYARRFYLHFGLLQLSLLLRLSGDLAIIAGQSSGLDLRRWGGLLNAVSLLVFFVNTATAIIQEQRTRASL